MVAQKLYNAYVCMGLVAQCETHVQWITGYSAGKLASTDCPVIQLYVQDFN